MRRRFRFRLHLGRRLDALVNRMTREQFEKQLRDGGFTEGVEGEYAPGCVNAEHTHPFEVRGLVLSGQMSVISESAAQRCGPGDVFVMKLGETHREEVGSDGVRYLYGSREH